MDDYTNEVNCLGEPFKKWQIIVAVAALIIVVFAYFYTSSEDEVANFEVITAPMFQSQNDTLSIKQEMRRRQIEVLKEIEIAKADRVIHEMQYQAQMDRERQNMEYDKIGALRKAKHAMYNGLIKKLEKMADDETLSFDGLYNKYKEKLQLFETDLLAVSDSLKKSKWKIQSVDWGKSTVEQ